MEALAHIGVHKWIDPGGLEGRAATQTGILETHHRFCAMLPEDLLRVENPETNERIRIEPVVYRNRYVHMGAHIPVSPGAVPRLKRSGRAACPRSQVSFWR